MKHKEIKHISDFLEVIETETARRKDVAVIVFRGEPQTYKKPCYPNLFRRKILERNIFFEKNQFDEMTANHLIVGNSYLEKAIDAQHGGFPSRLLDVTYNCLIALYFAVTPFYYEPEDKYDDEEGRVYVFPVKKMYCPTGNNINKAYDRIINRDCPWLSGQYIFQKNHKLIDHIKLNSRIIAQQGAFILFQGDEGEEIPGYKYSSITILGAHKAALRRELKDLCGIHTGSVYPEKYNLVNEIIEKSNRVSAKEFSFESELGLVILNLKECIEYYESRIEEISEHDLMLEQIKEMEREVLSFKRGIMCLDNMPANWPNKPKEYAEIIDRTKRQYNEIVSGLIEEMKIYLSAERIELPEEELIF